MKIVAALLFTVAAAHAEPVTLRIATAAPDGTAWAREARALGRDIEMATNGELHLKFYFGSITGDEMATEARIRRGQLDGIASGGMLCMKAAPTMRVLRIVGLFQSREESAYVAGRLRGTLDDELRRAGWINLGELGVGPDVPFSSTPIRTLDDLKRVRFWRWDIDPVYELEMPALGLSTVPGSLESAARSFEDKHIDGFIAIPTAALAFQWSTQVHYVSDLKISYLQGCFLIAARAFDPLPQASKDALRSASAKLVGRLEEIGRVQDEQLLGGLFARQGLQAVPATAALRGQFLEAARRARSQLGDKLVPAELLQKVQAMLADYRAEHRGAAE
jgi:TRAP-type C4-dicarboxylate transport system substrate-binding protein